MFGVGQVNHESFRVGVQIELHFHWNMLPFSSRNGLTIPFRSWKVNECFPPDIFQPSGSTSSSRDPATHPPRETHHEASPQCGWIPALTFQKVAWQRLKGACSWDQLLGKLPEIQLWFLREMFFSYLIHL